MEGHDMQYPVTRRTAVQAAVAALLLTALAACSSSSGADRDTATAQTVATEPPTTTTTNPYAVPAVIDAAYVNRVLAGLDAQMGDVIRLVFDTRTIPREAYDRMRAIYYDDQGLQLAIDGFQRSMRNGFAGYRPEPGNIVSKVDQILSAATTCIFVQVSRDYSAIGLQSTTRDIQWIALRPLIPQRDPQQFNQTNWSFSYEGYTETRSRPTDQCAG
jgi:hypothetical protein